MLAAQTEAVTVLEAEAAGQQAELGKLRDALTSLSGAVAKQFAVLSAGVRRVGRGAATTGTHADGGAASEIGAASAEHGELRGSSAW